MGFTLALLLLSLCFAGVAFFIMQVERKAKTCSVHDHRAGKAASVLGVLCGIVSVALFVGAFFIERLLS